MARAATNEGMAKNGVVTKGLSLFHERMAAGGVALTTVAYCATSLDEKAAAANSRGTNTNESISAPPLAPSSSTVLSWQSRRCQSSSAAITGLLMAT